MIGPFRSKYIPEKGFHTRQTCQSHVRTHDDSIKISCTICGKKFTQQQSLRHHADKFHNGAGFSYKRQPPKEASLNASTDMMDASMGVIEDDPPSLESLDGLGLNSSIESGPPLDAPPMEEILELPAPEE